MIEYHIAGTPGHIPDLKGQAATLVTDYIGGMIDTAQSLANEAKATINSIVVAGNAVPDISIPTISTIISVDTTLPTAPAMISFNPSFAGNIGFTADEVSYSSNLLNKLISTLYSGIMGSSTGIYPDIEFNMYLRENNRNATINQNTQDSIITTHNNLDIHGDFSLPLVNNQVFLSTNFNNAELDKGRQIIENTEKLSISFMQFIIEQAVKLESELIDFASKREDRRLAIARGIMESARAILDITAKQYQISLNKFEAEASVYSTKVESEAIQAKLMGDVKETAIKVQARIAEMQARVADSIADMVIRESNMRQDVLKMAAQAAAGLAAGAMTGAHASAGISFNESQTDDVVQGIARVGVMPG